MLKSSPFPRTNYVAHESDPEAESHYTTLASHLVHEWLNEALDKFELTCDIFYECDRCETSSGSGIRNENQMSGMSGYVFENSIPALKQLCLEALETSNIHLMNLSDGQKVDYLESYHTGSCSEHSSPLNSSKVSDLSSLQKLPAKIGKAEHNADRDSFTFLLNVDTEEDTANQFRIPVGQLLSATSLNIATSVVEDMAVSFNAAVDANSACTSAHTNGFSKCEIGIQDLRRNVACKVSNSSTSSDLSEDWNTSNSGSQILFSRPAVQVSLSLLHSHSFYVFPGYNS